MSFVATSLGESYFTTVRREPSIVSLWRMNDGAGTIVAADTAARYSLGGTYQNVQQLGPALIKDPIAASGVLGGTWTGAQNNGFSVGDAAPLRVIGDVSLEAWLAPYAAGQNSHLLGKLNSASTIAAPYALRLVGGAVQVAVGNGTAETVVSCLKPLAVGAPSHVVATVFRGLVSVYVNATLAGSGSFSSAAQSDAGQPFYAGEAASSGRTVYAGLMADAALYSGALSARRVYRHYALGQQVFVDPSRYRGVDPPRLYS
jgi:hypothetical protein